MLNLYLSSTNKDFEVIKSDILDQLDGLRGLEPKITPVRASTVGVVRRCLEDVAACDVYIGLIGFHYGWRPQWSSINPENLAITELEYLEAVRLDKPRLIFLAEKKGWDAEWVDDEQEDRDSVSRLRQTIAADPDATYESFSLSKARDIPLKILRSLDGDAEALRGRGKSEKNHPICPYPGLFSFSYSQRRWYFGRQKEISTALAILKQSHVPFLLISGASGTGKSSLVEAGVLPNFKPDGISDDDTSWFVRLRPAEVQDQPALALANRMTDRLPGHPLPGALVSSWTKDAANFLNDLHNCDPPITSIVVDQMEELFTHFIDNDSVQEFFNYIEIAYSHNNISTGLKTNVLASIRSDFKDFCQTVPSLRRLLVERQYLDLFDLGTSAVYQMVKQPAESVGLDVSEVVDDLVAETASKPTTLPLLAATLQTLWERRQANRLTSSALSNLGGMYGVIKNRADMALDRFRSKYGQDELNDAFDGLFSLLMRVSMEGEPVKKSVSKDQISNLKIIELADEFAADDIRLLCYTSKSQSDTPALEVVHESLFRNWPPLSEWIAARRTMERALAQARFFADDWVQSQNRDIFRLEVVRLHDAHNAMKTLGLSESDLDEVTREYLFPLEGLLSRLKQPLDVVEIAERLRIGDLLDQISRVWSGQIDARPGVGVKCDGLPNGGDSYWVKVSQGQIAMPLNPSESVVQIVNSDFRLAKFPITQAQFKSFIDAEDGYFETQNWPDIGFVPEPHSFPAIYDNRPVANVAWVEACAYCAWLNRRLRELRQISDSEVIRLPTEQEWQLASEQTSALNKGQRDLEQWQAQACEAGIMAVGLGPVSIANIDRELDFSSCIWEWCRNQYDDYNSSDFDPKITERAVRGGSFLVTQINTRERFRGSLNMFGRDVNIGFRVCIGTR